MAASRLLPQGRFKPHTKLRWQKEQLMSFIKEFPIVMREVEKKIKEMENLKKVRSFIL
ncbi:hypothetical protein DPMN_045809 [Dreissena polymorpha]|uniref:Uncharacterized protein n=1 Tax=Dreissena polymorpha TaxID=45954 RepID=A0A9D4I096_DREPO|nr:hypothetical protein DPMN_045809 [Dreissena polymorpha]